jgi:signal transduction histidine kinase/ActR/RegA family two-component response regulator
MQDFTKSLHIAPTLPIQKLVKDLTIGQRSTETRDQLSSFLHGHIFPQLDPFWVEIYYPDSLSDSFFPSLFPDQTLNRQKLVPENIPGTLPEIGQLFETGYPAELPCPAQATLFSTPTNNNTHLLVPIHDGPERLGLLYLGSLNAWSFTADFLDSLQTLAAVIGSRLKSMAVIQQLQESMHALEYADRLRTALYQISELAHNSENILDLYARLHQTMAHLIHAENFFIALVEERRDGKYIKFPYYADQNDTHFQGMELQLDNKTCSITGYLLKTRQPLLLTPTNFGRICQEHNIECVGTKPYSWLGAPFFVGQICGVVAIQSYGNVIYTEKDKEFMAFVARHIGDALNRKRAVDELKKSKERAERVEKNKSIFLANMSHEIRTPMNGILGLTDLVLHSDISGQRRTYLEMIYSSAERLLKLINDILDFSKIEAGKLELEIAPFSLRGTIAEALEILAVSASKKNIRLTVDCNEHIPDILLGDADKLSQILINLVGNGIKFTNEGQVSLAVSQKDLNKGVENSVELHFQIRDTGIGIPKTKTKNIFKAFSQLSTTRNSSQRGTGLGLVIAGELVEMMGGKICVESKAGVGTTFHFTVKFAPGPIKTQDHKNSEITSRHSAGAKLSGKPLHIPLRILLVEDEYINRTLAATVLEREGWQVTEAENGIQAMKMLQSTVFDLILMDIQMPELDGYETTSAIRRLEKNTKKHTPIIAVTAYAVKGDREKCLAAGMDGYISKPIRPEILRHEIETVLGSEPKIKPIPKPHN